MISQSGETKDLVNIVQDCRNKEKRQTVGYHQCLGINFVKNRLPIYIKVGREVSVAARKAFPSGFELDLLCYIGCWKKKQSA